MKEKGKKNLKTIHLILIYHFRVVLKIGSKASLSAELIDLQEEVRPLWKVPSCPRDFKRTKVERYFREAGFALDWCTFRLVSTTNLLLNDTHIYGNTPKLTTALISSILCIF